MRKGRKFAKSIEQESISRDQLSETFKKFGFIPSPTSIDLGEDFIVHIYIDGNPTGVLFHLQEKSITNLEERRKENKLTYTFDMQDIQDWQKFVEVAVVLIVWDINKRQGKWVLLNDALKYLDKINPRWRKNKSTVSLYFPWENSTDEKGLKKLRERIGAAVLPHLIRREDFSFSTLENDKDSDLLNQGVEKISTTGGEIVISGKHFVFPEWFNKWFDTENIQVKIEARLPEEPLYIKVTATDLYGDSYVHETELKMIERNKEVITFSNDHKEPSIRFEVKIANSQQGSRGAYNLNISVNNFGQTVYENRDLIKFIRAFITSGGGKVFISSQDQNPRLLQRENVRGEFPKVLEEFLTIVESLCKIQDRVSELLIIPVDGITPDELKTIQYLNTAIKLGKLKGKVERYEISIQKPGLEALKNEIKNGKNVRLAINDESKFKLFGKDITLGRMTRHIHGEIEKIKNIEKIIHNMDDDKNEHIIVIRNSDFEDYYLDLFLTEASRIGVILHQKFNIEKIFLFGNLVWEGLILPETAIELALDYSLEIEIEKIQNFCNSISSYPTKTYKFDTLPLKLQKKIEKLRKAI